LKRIPFFAFFVLTFITAACAPAATSPTAAPLTPTNKPATLAELRTRLIGTDRAAHLDAIARLEQNGTPDAVIILGEFFMNANSDERLDAGQALVRINTTQSQNYIRTAMSDAPLTARRQAAMQVLEADENASYPLLQKFLRDDNETVRLNTVQVVQFIGTDKARTLLQIALRDASPQVQKAAAEALQALGYVPSPKP
jgi:HEAT repeat protein